MAQTLEAALSNSGISKTRIGYVSANGTSTVVNDFCETQAIKDVFGKHAYNLLISASKSTIGHTVGASGPIASAVTALVLKTQKVPPTINYEFPDPDCDLNYVPNTMMEVSGLEMGIINSFGFGGHNCAIVLSRVS
jgi:3-oxoacyl-[acyl-carrier-protein] synthase II